VLVYRISQAYLEGFVLFDCYNDFDLYRVVEAEHKVMDRNLCYLYEHDKRTI